MTLTEKMIGEMNGFFRVLGDPELVVPKQGEWTSELGLIKIIREEYTQRLLSKFPQYRSLRPETIPDMFLMALNKQEAELRLEAPAASPKSV